MTDKKIMLDWAHALETTDRKQCTGNLAEGESRCCIGIFADMLGMDYTDHYQPVYDKAAAVSGESVEYFYLMNDRQKMSFKEIAVEVRKIADGM